MCFISTWVWEANELFSEYISSPPEYIELKSFIEYLDIPGNYEEKYIQMPGKNLILLKGDDNETYSNEELLYLDYVLTVVSLSIQNNEDEMIVFEIILKDIDDETLDLVSCAIIKIFNKGFKTKNLFIFKCKEKISLGSRYHFGAKIYDDFCLSKWYSMFNDLCELLEIPLSYYDSDSLQQIFLNISDQLMALSHLFQDDDIYNDRKFIRYLDTEQVITYMNKSYILKLSDEKVEKKTPRFYYRQISDELKFITPEELTSYDYLELAQKVEEKNINNQGLSITKQLKDGIVNDAVLEYFDSNVFNDAVSLLNHLNERE